MLNTYPYVHTNKICIEQLSAVTAEIKDQTKQQTQVHQVKHHNVAM